MGTLKARTGLAAATVAVLAMAGCARQDDTMSWAKAALARNDRLEIVAVDPQSHTFTVRVKDTGELRVVKADEVVGTAGGAAAAAAQAPGATAALPTNTGGQAVSPPNTPAAANAAPVAAEPAAPAAPAGASPAAGAEAAAGTPQAPPAEASALAPRGANAAPAGQVLESGPGYSIEAGARAVIPMSGSRIRDAGVTSAPLERRHEPIVCQGSRMLHIDNRNLEFEGDAVSAENGCELYITNSHITATGTGITASNANVHIDNSLIEGDAASLDAEDGGQIYAASSHFRGMSRQLDNAAVHDLGGNVWN
jgi:hypothetical protein